MLRIDRESKSLKRLDAPLTSEAGLMERQDIQQMIRNSSDEFFAEMGEKLLLFGEEVRPSDVVEDRIDLLAIDQQGNVVVIELKRGSNKLHLLQALSYASMISQWDADSLIAERAKLTGVTADEAGEEIEGFLLEDLGQLNEAQRIILAADGYDYEVLATSEWLSERYEVDIRCYRLALAADDSAEYLSCTCIFPPPELTQHAVRRRGQRKPRPPKWQDWEEALNNIENPAVVEFYQKELATGRDSYLLKRIIYYSVDGKRRLFAAARRKAAYVWQYDRFPGDVDFWNEKIGQHAKVQEVNSGQSVRFFLSSSADFASFTEAIQNDLPKVGFINRSDLAVPEDEQ